MLIKNVVLAQIEAGEIDTLFRRQKRPTVKTGGTLRTAVGVLDILRVDHIEPADISKRDATRAGFASVEELVAELARKSDGDVIRVRVRLAGPDPRLELREQASLSDAELDEVRSKLDRMDARSPGGPWTRRLLRLIDEHPHVRAPDLAASIGWETAPFKTHVRRLKTLGLTISHSPGYELSPRGKAVLARLDHR